MRDKTVEKKTDKTVKGPDTNQDSGQVKHSVSALQAASLGRSATEQTRRHSDSGLANTGTNISYEGATAPGSGGSAGTGYTSGKEGNDERISTDSDYDKARIEEPLKKGDRDPQEKKQQ